MFEQIHVDFLALCRRMDDLQLCDVETITIGQRDTACITTAPDTSTSSGRFIYRGPLLYLLCFEHVDNLGAYIASRPETGLLIPSDCVN